MRNDIKDIKDCFMLATLALNINTRQLIEMLFYSPDCRWPSYSWASLMVQVKIMHMVTDAANI